MSHNATRPFLWVAVVAGVVGLAVIVLTLVDSPVATTSDLGSDLADSASDPLATQQQNRPVEAFDWPRVDAATADRMQAVGETPAAAQLRAALEAYRRQSEDDQRRLGSDFVEMDKLWKKGRYGGNSPGSLAALEQLVERFGDTHRASCARYHLARQRARGGVSTKAEHAQHAQHELESLIERDEESRCDTGARASTLARFYLATQVFRHSDWDRSVELLEELAELDAGERDGLDVPISLRARGILQEVEQMAR